MKSMRWSVWVGGASVLVATVGCGALPQEDGALAGDEDVASSQHAMTYDWSTRFGDSAIQNARGVALDSSGNMVFAGTLGGTVDFGGGPLLGTSKDFYVAKVSNAGAYVWSKLIANSGFGGVQDVAVDSSDNVLVAGVFANPINFGGSTLTSAGSNDIFLVKLDSSGNHTWSKRFGNANQDHVTSLATDSSGNVIITGTFSGTLSFGGTSLTSAGGNDIFVAKFDSSGNHVWSKSFGSSTGYEGGNGVAVDSSGNVFVTGEVEGAVDFGGGLLSTSGSTDIFLLKLSSAGAHAWSYVFGDSSDDGGSDVAVDNADNVVFTGAFSNTVDLGGGPETSLGNSDGFVTKYDNAGTFLWTNTFTSAGYGSQLANGYRLATDPDRNVFVTGFMTSGLWFPAYVDTVSGNMFLLQFNEAGNSLTWTMGLNALQTYMAADAAGNLLVGGGFSGSINLGGGSLSASGISDIFIGKFTP